MESEQLPRKLAAILHADVAGYSRLTGEDEEGTHRALSADLDTLTTSIQRHNGKVLHYAGDAVLADFTTVSDALACAVAVQRDLEERNKDLTDERKVQFRIGVNLGEVIVDRKEIYGDGVNVAARLESLAEPGGVCISESVYAAVGNKLPLDYEFIGEQEVKNIAKPVRAYSAKLKADAVLPTPSVRPKTRRPIHYLIAATAAAVVLVIGVGVLAWLAPWAPTIEPASVERMAFPLPDKPSIAVLPFTNMSDDAKQEYFVDGMTEDLITDLSKISGLFVIARNSVFTYKGKPVKVRQVAEELGVRYVLEGSVRRAENQVRINAQLIDATTGGHVWAERYDGSLANVFAMQDEVTQKIVTALAVNLTTEEKATQARIETTNPKAYDAFLQGWAHYLQRTPDHYVKARGYFETAIELDPTYSRAYAALASVYWKSAVEGWDPAASIDRQTAKAQARKYLDAAMTNPTSLAHQVAAYMHLWRGRWDEAVAAGQRAVDRDPKDADGHVTLAEMLIYTGQPRRALDSIAKARRLDPRNQGYHASLSGLAQFGLEQFDAAAASLERALELNPELWLQQRQFHGHQYCQPCLPLVAAYVYLDRKQEAQALVRRLREQWRNVNVRSATAFWPFQHDVDRDRLARGLLEAGLPNYSSKIHNDK